MFGRSRRRIWRRGRIPLTDIADHAIRATDARLVPDWDHNLFPPDVPDLVYPSLSQLRLGHSMQFPATFAQSRSERHQLDRILTVITHQHPDLEYCPLLVHVIALLLKCTDAARSASGCRSLR